MDAVNVTPDVHNYTKIFSRAKFSRLEVDPLKFSASKMWH